MVDRAKVRDVYAEAAERPVADRAGFLDRACAGDPELRAEVESLLAAASRRPGFMGMPTAVPPRALAEAPGTKIGPYRLLEEIGEGGFGLVYMAEQEEPVRRRVALKVIKLGMDTRAVIARFGAERQALALMDHPHIAKVLDAGATEAGRPYFVMELVRGDPITAYCDKASLSIEERLGLFLQVCHAVQHAHSKGVIHRDIKPSNVLVSTQDGRAHAKVIDFGIAKATDHRLTEKTLFTQFRQFIGTPEYMSPEQAEGSLDIDTRTDVYSLGVLLYELLTGSTPFDPRALRSAAYGEIQRIIREEEPPKPSTRLSESAALPEVAAQRRTEPGRLGAMVRGDLDWIVMRALEKDRGHRYDTPSALAADIARHLVGEPVDAAPPSAGYRLGKFVRRNRGLVGAGASVAAALALGIVGTSLGLVRANRARADEADQRAAAVESARLAGVEAARAARAEADATARAAELEQVVGFQEAQLAGIDPHVMGLGLRADLLARARDVAERSKLSPDEVEANIAALDRLVAGSDFTGIALGALDENVLEPALEAIEEQFADQPLVRARLLQTVADTMRALGLLEGARAPQDEALAIRRRELGDDHLDTLTSINNAGCLMLRLGRYDESDSLLREVVAARRRLQGDDHADTLVSITNLGTLLETRGRWADAEEQYIAVLERRRRVLGEDDPATLLLVNNMGQLMLSQGRNADAEAYLREAVEERRRILGSESPSTLTSISSLALALQNQRKFSDAEALCREALEVRRRLLGDDHPHTLLSINNMGFLLHTMGRRAEAETYYRESLERKRRVMGWRHVTTLTTASNLASLLFEEGKLVEAEEPFREAVEGLRTMVGDEYPNTLFAMIGLGGVLMNTGRQAEAVAMLAPAEPAARKVLVNDHAVRLGVFLSLLGRCRAAAGEFDLAEINLTEAYAIQQAVGMNTAKVLQGLVDLFDARHRQDPDRGFDVRRDEWRVKLDAVEPPGGKP